MQRSVEELTPTKRRFTIEVPAEVLEDKILEALNNLRQSVKTPGFRPGKTPISLLDKRFGKDVESEVLEKVIPDYYMKAIQEEDIVPVTPPVFENYDFKRKSPLTMIFTIEIRPEIKDITYEGLSVEDEPLEVTEDELDNALQRLQVDKSSYEKVEDEVREEDLVMVDYEIVQEDQKVSNQFIKIGSDIIPADLSNTLKGKSAEDTFDVTTTFPEEFMNKNMKGKTLTLKGTVNEVKRLSEPELNDQFAKELGYEDVNNLKEAMKESIIKAKEDILKNRQISDLLEQMMGEHEFSVPEGLLESELNKIVSDETRRNPEADIGKLKEEKREDAIKNVKINLLLDVISEREKITVSDEEIKMRVAELSQSMYMTPENFVELYLPNENAFLLFKRNVIRQKVTEFILAKASKVRDKEEETHKEPASRKDEKGDE
jgi:trigger factor